MLSYIGHHIVKRICWGPLQGLSISQASLSSVHGLVETSLAQLDCLTSQPQAQHRLSLAQAGNKHSLNLNSTRQWGQETQDQSWI